jgi:manganese/zinc/iron transport system substrate-binding protein
VGGDAVEAVSLMKPGMSPHQFRPAAHEVSRMLTSDIVLRNGLGLDDEWPVDYEALENYNVRLGVVTSAIPAEKLIRREENGRQYTDPHVWMDPQLAVFMVHAVEAVLVAAMPKLGDYLSGRAQRLRVELGEADRFLRGLMAELPEKDRFLFTSHDSMAYFAKAYGLEAKSLAGADGKALPEVPAELAEWIRKHGVRTLFREQDSDEAVLAPMLKELRVVPDAVIYSLATGPADKIISMSSRQYNVSRISDAIRCTGDVVQSRLQVD